MLIRISPYQLYDSLGIINELCSQRVITLESGLSIHEHVYRQDIDREPNSEVRKGKPGKRSYININELRGISSMLELKLWEH